MAHYKRNAASNRDALFGGGGGGSSAKKSSAPRLRPTPASTTSRPSSSSSSTPSTTSSSGSGGHDSVRARLEEKRRGRGEVTSTLSGAAKLAKMKEAEEYRIKAKKAMTRGVFSSPDPIAAGNYYRRAAEAYKQCGENRLERLHRVASGDCQMGQNAYATAAGEYTRAAELAACSGETVPRKRQECHKLHTDAANAWRQIGENGRAGESMINAAFGLLIGTEDENAGRTLKQMDRKALKAIEAAVESNVPDPLNRYAKFRAIGPSVYVDPNADPNDPDAKARMIELAKQNMVTKSYVHETIFKAVYKLAEYGEYASALYATGAASATLEAEDFASISLSRAYCTETVLTLAMGDVVAADKYFLQVHLQKTSYLSARECKLAEDLIRAIKTMDADALEEARTMDTSNRSALANLHPCLRELAMNLRTSGKAKRDGGAKGNMNVNAPKTAPPSRPAQPAARAAPPTQTAPATKPNTVAVEDERPPPNQGGDLEGDELQAALDSNFAELDELMGDMGLDSDDDEAGTSGDVGATAGAVATGEYEEEDLDDDDIDLR
mmetsp:Transcript_11275/g.16615  ORF Transcript_11275/g.16615 Transcript_11275/m.16615 type:complete len:553 (-) Transcript_11275:75-1733(-)